MALTPSTPGSAEDTRIAELYRARSTEEPPARTDAAIRAAAHGAGPERVRTPPWWMAWRVPFAVASVAVVSATVAIMVREERPEQFAEAPVAAAPPASEPAPAREPAAQAPAAPLPEAAREPRLESGNTAGAIRAPARIAPAQPQAAREAPGAPAVPDRQDATPETAAAREAPAADAAVRKESRAAASAIGVRGLEAEDPARDRVSADAKPAAPPVARAASPAPMSAPASPAPRAKVESAGGVDIGALKAELEREPPRRWVERIAALRRDGRNAEADALAAEFRRRFPDEPLPGVPESK